MYKFTGVGMDAYTDTSTYAETGRFRMQMHVYGICGVSGLVSTSVQSIRISFVLSKCHYFGCYAESAYDAYIWLHTFRAQTSFDTYRCVMRTRIR